MSNNLKLRVHIAPVGFELDRIVIPAKKMRADKVWLISHTVRSADKARPFLEKIKKTLEKNNSHTNLVSGIQILAPKNHLNVHRTSAVW